MVILFSFSFCSFGSFSLPVHVFVWCFLFSRFSSFGRVLAFTKIPGILWNLAGLLHSAPGQGRGKQLPKDTLLQEVVKSGDTLRACKPRFTRPPAALLPQLNSSSEAEATDQDDAQPAHKRPRFSASLFWAQKLAEAEGRAVAAERRAEAAEQSLQGALDKVTQLQKEWETFYRGGYAADGSHHLGLAQKHQGALDALRTEHQGKVDELHNEKNALQSDKDRLRDEKEKLKEELLELQLQRAACGFCSGRKGDGKKGGDHKKGDKKGADSNPKPKGWWQHK